MESPGTCRWLEGVLDEARQQKRRGAHHLGQTNPTSEAATVDMVDSSHFLRQTVAVLEAGGRGCRRYVGFVGDVHILTIALARAVLDSQTAPVV